MTTVINIKDAPKGWQTNPDYVYIGRAGKGFDGFWGNPYKLKTDTELGRQFLLMEYMIWLLVRIYYSDDFRQKLSHLKGKTLVCFCKPKLCHGDVLQRLIDPQ